MTNTGSWSIGNKTVQSLTIGNKEVETIERVSDGAIIYQKAPSYKLTLVSDKTTVGTGETVTFTATLTLDGVAVSGETITFSDGVNTLGTSTTNNNGVATLTYSWNSADYLSITAIFDIINSKSIQIMIGDILIIKHIGSTFSIFGGASYPRGLNGSNMVIDWGDGTTQSLTSNTDLPNHTYSNSNEKIIKITGNITEIGNGCFTAATGISNVILPKTITTIGNYVFTNSELGKLTVLEGVTSIGLSFVSGCSNITSISLPSTITSIDRYAFKDCPNLIDYQFYWDTPPIKYENKRSSHMFYGSSTNAYFTIPNGTTANYVAKSFPSNKLIERSA